MLTDGWDLASQLGTEGTGAQPQCSLLLDTGPSQGAGGSSGYWVGGVDHLQEVGQVGKGGNAPELWLQVLGT